MLHRNIWSPRQLFFTPQIPAGRKVPCWTTCGCTVPSASVWWRWWFLLEWNMSTSWPLSSSPASLSQLFPSTLELSNPWLTRQSFRKSTEPQQELYRQQPQHFGIQMWLSAASLKKPCCGKMAVKILITFVFLFVFNTAPGSACWGIGLWYGIVLTCALRPCWWETGRCPVNCGTDSVCQATWAVLSAMTTSCRIIWQRYKAFPA